ncbi:MAG TPA: sigma-70 family RNA polymerase sigma factor [Candidatus Udaeobacter sp.]|nr:sigma-70 family RNA polymerase sigma factor [Candidatus Udaeobacter sp.]
MNTDSDEKLVALYLQGDESALRILVQKYTSGLYNFTAQFVGYGQNAEDVAQEAFIKAWKSLSKFDLTKKFKPWLYQIARNSAIDFLRQRKLTISLSDTLADDETKNEADYLVDPAPLPLAQSINLETKEAVQNLIKSLPLIYGTVLKLYYLEEFSLPEIAQVLGEPLDTIKSRHRRALLRLRKLTAESKLFS